MLLAAKAARVQAIETVDVNFRDSGRASMPGLHFEESQVGQVFKHQMRRTVTESDNVWFSTARATPRRFIWTSNGARRIPS